MTEYSFQDNTLVFSHAAPLDIGRCCACGQSFRWKARPDGYFGVVRGRSVLAEQQSEALLLHGAAEADAPMWADYFDLQRDYNAIETLIAEDPRLALCLPYARGIRVFNQEPFEALISFIISANNNIKRISGIVERLCELAGERERDYYRFPEPQAIARLNVEQLTAIGAGYRAPYIKSSAARIAEGYDLEALRGMPLDAARKELLGFLGVGPKVADCVLLFSLGHTDAFPIDVWMGRAMKEMFFDSVQPTKAELDRAVRQLGPYSGLVQQYIFHYAREKGIK